jgi:hypothetical protein
VKIGEVADPTVPVDLQELRTWLLYWDKLVIPNISRFPLGRSAELDYLRHVGFYSEQPIEHPGGEVRNMFVDARHQVFEFFERREPGVWAIASPFAEDSLLVGTPDRALRVRLNSMLPVPDQEVPLEDIMFFRERRAAERQSLMSHLDEAYLSILASPDRPLAEHTAFERVATSARDQLRAVGEASFSFRLLDLASDFNLLPAAMVAIGSVAAGATWPFIVGNSLLAGGSISVGKTIGLLNSKTEQTPYRYVTSYHNEVFRPE